MLSSIKLLRRNFAVAKKAAASAELPPPFSKILIANRGEIAV